MNHPNLNPPALLLAALLAAANVSAQPLAAESAAGAARPAAAVRRWEFVVLVRTRAEAPEAIGRAETAAFRSGAAVLQAIRTEATEAWSDHRLLVRVRDRALLGPVLRDIRLQPGVLGASATPLPETPTEPGGPSFMLSYTATEEGRAGEPGIFVHHDVPPVLDKADLLHVIDVPVGPSLDGGSTVGSGLGFNISALIQRLRHSAWAKRERRMRDAYLPILPPEGMSSTP